MVVGFDIELRSSSYNTYFGLWYDEYELMEKDEYTDFFADYYSKPHSTGFCVLFPSSCLNEYSIDYEAKGFICYYQDGTERDLFDEIRVEKLRYYVEGTDVVGRVIYEADGFDYKTQHDPLLIIFE